MRPPRFDLCRGKHDLTGRRFLAVWSAVVVLVVAAIVMVLLGAEPLHESADRMQPSWARTAALAVTGGIAQASGAIHADWPWRQVADEADEVVLGDAGEGGEADGDMDQTSPSTTVTSLSAPTTTSSPPTTAGGATASTSTTTTTLHVTTTTTLPSFTKDRPLRVLVVGDSLMNPIGFALMRQREAYPALEVKAITKASSGFVRPDFYNWPQVLGRAVAEFHPHVTVMLFGGNEKQTMHYQGHSLDPFSDAWNAEYAKRVEQGVEISTTAGASVIWIGMPIMRSGKFSETARTLNAFYSTACAKHPGAVYIDGYGLFSDSGGKYSAYLPDSTGENRLMRSGDGIHFTDKGGDRVAEAVIKVLLTAYRLE
jgi:hypothetical protein